MNVILPLLALYCLVLVDVGGTTAQKQATCSNDAQERTQACLDQIERDEAALKTGFCTSTNWTCICAKQQGIGDCFSLCPDLIPSDKVRFDRDNCAGQHQGVRINDLGGTLIYTWSDLNVPLSGAINKPSSSTTTNTTQSDQESTDDQSTSSSSSLNDPGSQSPSSTTSTGNVTMPNPLNTTTGAAASTNKTNLAPTFKHVNGTTAAVVALTLILLVFASL